jgi:triacylglycerol esterase/lipase EstA (alpha/beta hydrolase family)
MEIQKYKIRHVKKDKVKHKNYTMSTLKYNNILHNYAKYSHADVPNIYTEQMMF